VTGGTNEDDQDNPVGGSHLSSNSSCLRGRLHTDANAYTFEHTDSNSDSNVDAYTRSWPHAAASRERTESD